MTEPVELRPAHAWDCPECGRENFARCIVASLPPDELAIAKERFGFSEEQEGCFLTKPDFVTCMWCHTMYETCDYERDCDEHDC